MAAVVPAKARAPHPKIIVGRASGAAPAHRGGYMNRTPARVIAIELMVLLVLPSLAPAQERWYSDCQECYERMGGLRTAGPYPSKGACETAIAQLPYPFGPCHPADESAATESSGGFSARAIHKHWILFGVMGGVLGGVLAYALAPTLPPSASYVGGGRRPVSGHLRRLRS